MSDKHNSKRGFTLVELILVIIMYSIFSVICMGILQSVFVSQRESTKAMKDQIALRQALLTVTREIRKEPDDSNIPGLLEERYKVLNNNLIRVYDSNSVVAQNILTDGFELNIAEGNAVISITSINNVIANTQIHLRTSY